MTLQSTTDSPLVGTKLQIVEAAQRTLRTKGFAGTSAREIAAEGDFNQALIFYHFGSVKGALLAVLDEVSTRRMAAYGDEFDAATTASELAALARRTHDEDLEHGYIAVLCEMVAAGMTDPELGPEVVERLEPWIQLVERKVEQFADGSPLAALANPNDIAFALVALYLGVDMLTQLQGNAARANGLLDIGARAATLLDAFRPSGTSPKTEKE